MTKLIASACCAAVLAFAPAAMAVDVENQDSVDYKLDIAIGDGGPTTMTIKAGETKTDVCGGSACVIELDGKNWNGFTNEHVVIKDKKLMTMPKRG